MSNEVKSGILEKKGQKYFPVTDVSLVQGLEDINDIRAGATAGATAYQKPQTGIPASDLASGVIPSVPVQDVTVGGTSVVSSGTAAIVEASSSAYGVVKVDKVAGGINKDSNGKLILDVASNAEIEARSTACALKVSQIDKAVKEGVANNSLTLTSAEQTAAKSWLGVNDTPEIFWATYGTTTAAEIDAAVSAEKAVMCYYNNNAYFYASKDANYIYFGNTSGETARNIPLNISTNNWGSPSSFTLQKTANRVTSWQTTPDDTHYPSEKLVKDSIDAVDKVFIATYGTTTYSDIATAYNAGKIVIVEQWSRVFILTNFTAYAANFSSLANGVEMRVSVDDNDSWSNSTKTLEDTANKVTSLSSSSTDTEYPSAKCVYDLIGDVETLINAL